MNSFTEHENIIESLSLTIHDDLNPLIWQNFKLKNEVRLQLLKITKAWIEYANIPWESVIDVSLVGGNANYNYTEHSDIDVHILMDKSKLSNDFKLIADYLNNKKQLWSIIHDIKIFGHEVELYAQDISDGFQKDQGVYSILHDKWILRPNKKEANIDTVHVEKKAEELKHRIDSLISMNANYEDFNILKNKIKNMRLSGLKRSGEFSYENLAFKELRNTQYLNKMNKYMNTTFDKELSM